MLEFDERPSDCSLDEAVRGAHRQAQLLAQQNMDLNDKLTRQSEELAESRAQLRGYSGPLGLGEREVCRGLSPAKSLLSSIATTDSSDAADGSGAGDFHPPQRRRLRQRPTDLDPPVSSSASSSGASSVYHSLNNSLASHWHWSHTSTPTATTVATPSNLSTTEFVYPPNVNAFYSLRDAMGTLLSQLARSLGLSANAPPPQPS
uniref:Uncharacterized protein n=1 Tax=Caenorhabditis japonica TaxID=281687 RepID=A0A8R1IHQ1_CAEJA